MGRVRHGRAASVASGADRHRFTDQKKASYKVVFEEITRKRKLETFLSSCKVPPKGYTFIPAGDMQLTKRCKSYSKFFGTTVFIVSTSAHPGIELSKQVHRIGYHFSTFVVDKACESLGVTLNRAGRVIQSHFAYLNDDELQESAQQRSLAAKRSRGRVQRHATRMDTSLSQAVVDSQAREAIMDLFPNIPPRDLHEIVSRAFDMNSGNVGTAENTSLVLRANLAVVAHIRHMYTNYDLLLKIGMSRSEARRGIEKFTLNKLVSWRGDDDNDDNPLIEEVLREVVVISDDEEELDEEETSVTRGASSRDARDGKMPSRTSQTPTIDLTILEDEDESEDEASNFYHRQAEPYRGRAVRYDREREARMGHERHSRWEQALERQKQNPVSADSRDIYNASFDESEKAYSVLPTNNQNLRPIPGLDSYNHSIAQSNKILTPAIEYDAKCPTAELIPIGDDLNGQNLLSAINSGTKHHHQNFSQGHTIPKDSQLPNAYYRVSNSVPNLPARVPHSKHMVQDPSGLQPEQPALSADTVMPSVEGDHFDQQFKIHKQSKMEHIVADMGNKDAHEPKRRRIDNFHRPSHQNSEPHAFNSHPGTILIPLDGPRSYSDGPLYEVSSQDYTPKSQLSFHNHGKQGQIQQWNSQHDEFLSQNTFHRSTLDGPQMAYVSPNGVQSYYADRINSSPRSPLSLVKKPRLVRLQDAHASPTALASNGQKISGFNAAKTEQPMPLSSDTSSNLRSCLRQLSISEKAENQRSLTSYRSQLQPTFPPEEHILNKTNHRIIQMPSQKAPNIDQKKPARLVRLGQVDTTRNDIPQETKAAPPRQIVLSDANPISQGPTQRNRMEGRSSLNDLRYQSSNLPSSAAIEYYDPRVPNIALLQKEHIEANRRRQDEVIVLDG